jgi:hypothetical protein
MASMPEPIDLQTDGSLCAALGTVKSPEISRPI